MKFKINAKLFEELVSTAAQAISSKPLKPESECVYVEVNSDSGSPIMTVLARDAGLAIKKATDAIEADEDGKALIPAKKLISFLKLMRGDVTVNADETQCTLKSGSKKSSISCMDAEDYDPDFTPVGNGQTVIMDGSAFLSAVESVSHCVGTDAQGRIVLTGIHFAFDAESGTCEAVGLDGFRLALARKPAETNETFTALIPAAFARLIGKIVGASEGVSFRFGKGVVIVEDYTTAIEAALLAGEYINYTNLCFRRSAMQAMMKVDDLLDAVKLAQVSASDNKSLILMDFSKENTIRVSARSDVSEAVSEIDVGVNGQMDGGPDIAFNGKYVEDALKAQAAYGENAALFLNKPTSPMAILPIGRDDYYQLVLPVRRLNKDS